MKNLLSIIKRNWAVLTAVIFITVSVLTLLPLDRLPPFPGTDKTHHVIAYMILMFPAALRKPRYWQLLGLFFVLYSGLIELIQPYVNRYAEWLDLAANGAGVLLGVLLAELMSRLVMSPKSF